MTKNTPLHNYCGVSSLAADDNASSYLSIHNSLSNKAKSYSGKYSQFVVDYVTQWQQTVHTRVDKALKDTSKFRVELDHYESKVESLRQSANQTMAKGKQVDDKMAEKLTRNEEKLEKIKQDYFRLVSNTTTLIEEVTGRSWRDIHPVLVKIFQFDMTISSEEAKSMSNLGTIIDELKKLATDKKIKTEGRLREIEAMDPSKLSTGDGGTALPMIEAGMGDFSISSKRSNISTMDMMAISQAAAPPPSMDQLEAAFGGGGGSIGSAGSFDSGFGGNIAPAPITAAPIAAPPLPPQGGGHNPFGQAPSSYPTPSTNPFGAPPPPPASSSTNPFGPPTPPAASGGTNPFGGALPPPRPSYGASNSYGAPPMYGNYPPSQAPPAYPSQQQAYGQPQKKSTNPFDM